MDVDDELERTSSTHGLYDGAKLEPLGVIQTESELGSMQAYPIVDINSKVHMYRPPIEQHSGQRDLPQNQEVKVLESQVTQSSPKSKPASISFGQASQHSETNNEVKDAAAEGQKDQILSDDASEVDHYTQ